MKSTANLAYHTLCEPTSADAIVRGNFRYPESNDVVIVKGRHLTLYTLLKADEENGIPRDQWDIGSDQAISKDEVDQRFGRHVVNDGVRFVSQITLLGAPVATRLLPDFIFHSYDRTCESRGQASPRPSCESSQQSDNLVGEPNSDASASHPIDGDNQTISSEEVRATSALVLAFEFGRVMVIGFDRSQNRFVTLSMHVLDRKLDPNDDEQYMELQLRDKIRITTVNETYIAACSVRDWFLLSRRRTGNQCVAVYGRRYVVAYCYNERTVHIIALCAEFKRPTVTRRHSYFPFGDNYDSNIRTVDGDNRSVVMVPWLRVESLSEFNVDAKLGFCDASYFVRGMDLCFDYKMSVLGLLVATKPEAVGTHVAYGCDTIIGGMSFIAISVYPETRSCTVVQRLDSLPIDTDAIIGVPPSV